MVLTWSRNILYCLLKPSFKCTYYEYKLSHQLLNVLYHPKLKYHCMTTCLLQRNELFFPPLLQQPARFYAKSKDKKKDAKGQKKKVEINQELLVDVVNIENMHEQMKKSIEKLKEEFIKNLSLRSSSGSVESLPITFEGKDYVLQDVAQVVRKNPKTMVINMAAFPQLIPSVLQAISKSGMNLNPQQDGTTLYVPIPKVTKEHREVLAKNAKALFIKCRDNIKEIQNKCIKTVKNKEKDGLAKDTSQQICDHILYQASEYVNAAEVMLETKQKELLKESS